MFWYSVWYFWYKIDRWYNVSRWRLRFRRKKQRILEEMAEQTAQLNNEIAALTDAQEIKERVGAHAQRQAEKQKEVDQIKQEIETIKQQIKETEEKTKKIMVEKTT